MSAEPFLRALRSQLARAATGSSAVRGKGNAGVAAAARRYLAQLDLAKLATDPEAFPTLLDQRTSSLLKAFKGEARQRWGLARKLINLFLRDAVSNVHLRKAYHLAALETRLELPLDRESASRLGSAYAELRKRDPLLPKLPRWHGVSKLRPDASREYQSAAVQVARNRQLRARVHLDAFFWAFERD